MRQITVVGGGSWGTALAHLLASAGHATTLLVRDAAQATNINQHHVNPRYLATVHIHDRVEASTSTACLQDAELVILALPCQNLRAGLTSLAPHLSPRAVLVNTAKGVETGTGVTPSHIMRDICPHLAQAVLSGPSFALEVIQEKPTAVVLACTDEALGAQSREVFATPWFRTYSSTDVTGVELGGAVKNVIAIAAGIADGLGFGHNTRAALITRGLAEITRLGMALGAYPATFMGLSGMGDLMLTCAGDLSRNRQVGLALGQGLTLEQATERLHMVAEGVKTTQAVHALAQQHHVDMPVTEAVYAMLYQQCSPCVAVQQLMGRELREEA